MTEPERIDAFAHDTAHVAASKALLAQQFRLPNIEAVLGSYTARVQEIEDALWSLLTMTLDDAVGAHLDQLGELLGQGRAGLDDTLYRALLRATTLAIGSSGTGDRLAQILIILGTNTAFDLRELFPASLLVAPFAAPDIPAPVTLAMVKRSAAAGVRVQVVDVPSGDVWAFAAADNDTTDSAHGFSDTTEAAGGQLAGVLEAR